MKDDRILLVLEMRTEQREWKKLTMVKAQAYLKVGKTEKSEVLDDFCEEEGYCRRHAARVLHQAASCIILIHRERASHCIIKNHSEIVWRVTAPRERSGWLCRGAVLAGC